jgi:riboflavin kinase/FMN adenylyltransferase
VGERWWPAAVNIGRKPTFGGDEGSTVELHLVGFSGDLYDQQLRALFVDRLRPEQRFSGIDALKEQIGHDVAKTGEIIAKAIPLGLDPPTSFAAT